MSISPSLDFVSLRGSSISRVPSPGLGFRVFALARRTRTGGASARLTRGRIGTRAFVGATGIKVFRAARHRRG